MKKFYTLSLIAFSAITMFAQSIPFTGTGLLSANGWVITGTPTAPAISFPGPLSIVSTASDSGNSLSFAGLAPSTGNRTRITHNDTEDCNFATATYTGIVYYSALLKVLNTTNTTATTGEYFLNLSASAGTGSGTFVGRLFTRPGATATSFNFGLLNNSGGTNLQTFAATEYVVNQTYFVVVKYDRATNTATLFVNATPGVAEPGATLVNAAGTGVAPAQIAAFNIRQAGSVTAATSSGNIEIDEIRISDTWAGVTPTTLSTNQNTIAGLSIYPNPVKGGVLYIDTQAKADKNVAVFDVLGKQVINVSTASNAVNVSGLTDGVYIVKITENGNTATRKLVINN